MIVPAKGVQIYECRAEGDAFVGRFAFSRDLVIKEPDNDVAARQQRHARVDGESHLIEAGRVEGVEKPAGVPPGFVGVVADGPLLDPCCGAGTMPGPSDCGTCHKLKPQMPRADFDPKLATAMKIQSKVMMDAWRLRSSSGKFQHEFMAHVDLPCSTCHTVTAMKTDDPSTLKVPIASCATCHATATADGGGAINYEIDARKKDPKFECVKCHTAFGKLAVPALYSEKPIGFT